MGGGMGSFVEGLAGGMMQGQKQSQQKQLLDAQTTLIKAQAKAAEAELNAKAQEEAWWSTQPPEAQAQRYAGGKQTLGAKLKDIMSLASQGQGAPVPLPPYDPESSPGTGPTRPGAMSIPETVAQGQMGGLGISREDLLQGVMKKELGVERSKFNRFAEQLAGPGGLPWVVPMDDRGEFDWTKAYPKAVRPDMQKGVGDGMTPTETPVNPYTRQPAGAPIQTGPPPTMQVDTMTPGGGKVRGVVPLFPGGSKVSGTTAGGVRTELDLLDVPIPATEVTKWSDGQGNSPPVGWTPRQAQGRGFKQTQEGMPAETGGKVVMLSQAVTDMEKAIELFLPKTGGFNRKLAIGVWANAPEDVVPGAQIARSSMLNAMSAKLRMETGAQSNESEIQGIIDRYRPSGVRDNEKSARFKMERLLNFMRAGKFIMDPKGRILMVEPPAEKKKPDLSLGKEKGAGVSREDAIAELRRRKVIP